MRDELQFVLPAALREALQVIANGLTAGQVSQSDLRVAVSSLGALPPDAIGRADYEIAYVTELFHHQPPQGILSWWQRPRSHHDLLRDVPGLAYLFLFHRDGRLREVALNRINDGLNSAFFFAAIAYRLNDWAAPVRAAAVSCAERVFPKTDSSVITAAAVFLLDRRQQWKRWQSEVSVLSAALCRSDVAEQRADIIHTAKDGPMGTVLRRALQDPGLDHHLDRLSTAALLPHVRAVALQALIEGRAAWPIGRDRLWVDKRYGLYRLVPVFDERTISRPCSLEVLIDRGARDRSALVRKVAAAGLIQYRASLTNLDSIIQRLANDRNRTLRERIEFILSERSADRA